ncbi:Type I restriction enzyme EcoKI specificity protein [Rhodococcus rhodochrous]|nr:Type I restriction enzyme EcoKI specificity protein [Rhodococcus rhodochrous]
MVRLADVLVEFAERPKPGATVEVLTLTERNGFVRQRDRFNKRLATEDTSKYKVVRPSDIAFNPYLLWAGAIAQNQSPDPGIISPLYPTFRVREGFDPKFIYRLLLTAEMIQRFDGIAFGSVPRRRRTSVKDFLELEIPTPPKLEEQRRIASILDHADTLRAKRREAIARLDELTQSIFIDMFGGVFAEASTESVKLRDLGVAFTSGLNVVAGAGEQHITNRVLKVNAISRGTFNSDELKPMPASYQPPESHRVHAGDLLATRASGTVDLICIATEAIDPLPDTFLPDKIWKIDTGNLGKNFVIELFRHPYFRRFVRNSASGASGVRNISQAKVLAFEIAAPKPEDVVRFERVVAAVRSQASLASSQARSFEAVLSSLQSRAFRGEL